MASSRRPRWQHGAGCPRHRAAVGHRGAAAHDLDLRRSARHSVLCRGHAAAHERPASQRTDHPLTTSVFGTAYTTPGRWQQLEIVNFPRILAGQVRILRSQLGHYDVDAREAYVSRVLLNIYGGPGVTNVWTDDLEVFGHVPSARNASFPAPPAWRLRRRPPLYREATLLPEPRYPRHAKSSWPARS